MIVNLKDWLLDNELLTETQVETLLNGVVTYSEWESVVLPTLKVFHGSQWLFDDMVLADTVSEACFVYMYQYKYKYKRLYDSMLDYDLAYNSESVDTTESERDVTDTGTIGTESSNSLVSTSETDSSQKKSTYDSSTMKETDSSNGTDSSENTSTGNTTQTNNTSHNDSYSEDKTHKERNGDIENAINTVRNNAMLSVIGVIIQDILLAITYNQFDNDTNDYSDLYTIG